MVVVFNHVFNPNTRTLNHGVCNKQIPYYKYKFRCILDIYSYINNYIKYI